MGLGTQQLQVAAYADDSKRYCASTAEVEHLATGPVPLWKGASGQIFAVEKFTVVLLGHATTATLPDLPVKAWQRYGTDAADKSLGIRVGTPLQVAEQWYAKRREVEQLATDVTAGRRLAGSIYARSAVAKGGFGSKVIYGFKIQAPYEGARTLVFNTLQVTLNRLVFGGYCDVTIATAQQPCCDAGASHLHLERRMNAEWAHLVVRLMDGTSAAWKNIWWKRMRDVYGPLCDRDMPLSSCTYQLMQFDAGPSQVQQLALAAWGQLKQTPAQLVEPEMTTRRQTAIELAAYDGEPPPVAQKVWEAGRRDLNGAQVGELRLWFNTALSAAPACRMHAPSTYSTEREAIKWALDGLVRNRDAVEGTRMLSVREFTDRHSTLDHRLYSAMREGFPAELTNALADRTCVPTAERCLPADLLDTEGPRQQYAIACERTLISRPLAPMSKLRMGQIYTAMTAAAFTTPRTLNPEAGAAARHVHMFDDEPEGAARERAIARAVRCIKHAAVPPEMTDTAFKVLHSGFAFGPNKRGICHRDACPCGMGHAETVEHTFHKCARSFRLWELLTTQWREVTGETKITADHGRVVLLGDRSGTWATEADEAEWAGLEEPWAVMHKVALHVLFLERNKDAAPHPPTRRTAQQLYQTVQTTVQRIVNMRWRTAVAKRRHDAGQAIAAFRRRWEAPGLVVIRNDSHAQLVLFMNEAARSRWRRRAANARAFRNQQHAPPEPPPDDMIEIYIAGSADVRKKNQPPPPGGYGAIAVRGGQRVFEMAGIISTRTPNVKTITENLALLVAAARALQWAEQHGMARGSPICIRYNSEYAARICTGQWKARKHKLMAEEARNAWAQVKQRSGGQVWTRHASRKDPHYLAAIGLAAAGKGGRHVYAAVIN